MSLADDTTRARHQGAGSTQSSPTQSSPTLISPTLDDEVLGALTEVVGGPAGRYRRASSLKVAVNQALLASTGLAAISMIVALWLRSHCRTTQWKAPDQFTHLCYSDIPALFSSGGLGTGVTPYLDAGPGGYLAQPVGTGGLLYLIGLIAPGGRTELRSVFDVGTIFMTIALVALVAAMVFLAGRRAWDATLLAASPVIAFSALVSLDLAAVALAVCGMLAFSRSRPILAGVLVGLGASVRPFMIVVLVAVLIVAYTRRRLDTVGSFAVATSLGFTAVNLPVFLLNAEGWGAYWAAVWRSDISYGSLLLAPQILSTEITGKQLPSPSLWLGTVGLVLVAGYLIVLAALPAAQRGAWRPKSTPVLALVCAAVVVVPFVLIAAGVKVLPALASPVSSSVGRVIAIVGYPLVVAFVVWIARTASYPPRLAPVALMVACGWMLVSPGVPVQAGLWLLPFIVLTEPRWRLLLTWAAIEVSYGSITWLYLYGLSVANRGAPGWLYIMLLLARLTITIWLFWRAWALTWWPMDDVVRRDCGDDPHVPPALTQDRVDGAEVAASS